MIDDKEIISVTNRNNGTTGYVIPDLGNLHRSFTPGETKKLTMEELRKLSYVAGGRYILENYLIIDNEDAIAELLSEVEPEYHYGEEEVKELLLKGSAEQLMDALDFAPAGVIDLIKNYAVDLKINDLQKREIILEKTGFNVSSAIFINEETSDEATEEVTTGRRAAPVKTERKATPAKPTRQYKVVSK